MRRAAAVMLLCALMLSGCAGKSEPALTVDVLKSGQADAILIVGEDGTSLMLDAGEKDDAEDILALLKGYGIERLDMLVATHFDKDHVGGAPELLSGVGADTVYIPAYTGEGKPYDNFMQAISALDTVTVTEDIEIALGSAKLTLIPAKAEYEGDNDNSLMATLTHGQLTMFFAGDAETPRVRDYLAQESCPQGVALLKVPHHGVYDEGAEELIRALAPAAAVITCSDKNPAEAELLDVLSDVGADVYMTRYGDLHITSDGERLKIDQNM